MRVDGYKAPTSRFLSVDKDIATISELFRNNDRLCRLLYRTGTNPITSPNLSEAEKNQLFQEHYIRRVPRVTADTQTLNYIVINFNHFTPSLNPEYRDNRISITILCHFDQWLIDGGMLRPYRIAAEIDTMLDNAKLSGIGTLQFVRGEQIIVKGDFGGIELTYQATHGEDDKKNFDNLAMQLQFLEEELSKKEK